jgi:hypothetical protein
MKLGDASAIVFTVQNVHGSEYEKLKIAESRHGRSYSNLGGRLITIASGEMSEAPTLDACREHDRRMEAVSDAQIQLGYLFLMLSSVSSLYTSSPCCHSVLSLSLRIVIEVQHSPASKL